MSHSDSATNHPNLVHLSNERTEPTVCTCVLRETDLRDETDVDHAWGKGGLDCDESWLPAHQFHQTDAVVRRRCLHLCSHKSTLSLLNSCIEPEALVDLHQDCQQWTLLSRNISLDCLKPINSDHTNKTFIGSTIPKSIAFNLKIIFIGCRLGCLMPFKNSKTYYQWICSADVSVRATRISLNFFTPNTNFWSNCTKKLFDLKNMFTATTPQIASPVS